jgi:FtsZ-interacting cell division protein ZipA
MPAWLIITIIVIALVGIVAFVFMLTVGPWGQHRRLASRRKETRELRREAEQHFARAGEHASAADQEQDRAQYEREEAEDAVRRADETDPDKGT